MEGWVVSRWFTSVLFVLLMLSRVSVAKAEDLQVVASGDPETDELGRMAKVLFDSVKKRNNKELIALAGSDDVEYLQKQLADQSSREYKALYTDPESAGVLFKGWEAIRWVAARNRALERFGGGVVLCIADSRGPDKRWPPKGSELRKREKKRDVFCVSTYMDQNKRVAGFNFLYPEGED